MIEEDEETHERRRCEHAAKPNTPAGRIRRAAHLRCRVLIRTRWWNFPQLTQKMAAADRPPWAGAAVIARADELRPIQRRSPPDKAATDSAHRG